MGLDGSFAIVEVCQQHGLNGQVQQLEIASKSTVLHHVALCAYVHMSLYIVIYYIEVSQKVKCTCKRNQFKTYQQKSQNMLLKGCCILQG